VTTANRLVALVPSAARMRAFGRGLARLLRAGDVLLLQGPLGAGKTTLAQGIGAGLRVEGPVRSPSFVLLAHHPGALPLYHADLYRLDAPADVAELALAEQARDGVLLVEWPERALDELPGEHLLVVIEPRPPADARTVSAAAAPTERRLTLVARGDRYRALLDALVAARLAERV
jgi:tRNA threonylcarbamoyladenosine biosynthesis protein TsaE